MDHDRASSAGTSAWYQCEMSVVRWVFRGVGARAMGLAAIVAPLACAGAAPRMASPEAVSGDAGAGVSAGEDVGASADAGVVASADAAMASAGPANAAAPTEAP